MTMDEQEATEQATDEVAEEAVEVEEVIAEEAPAEAVAAKPKKARAKRTAPPKSLPADVPNPNEPGPGNPSPDGKWLAFLQRGNDGDLYLWVLPVDGGELKSFRVPFPTTIDERGPQWSPDSRYLAMTGGHPADGRSTVWFMDPFDGAARILVDHPATDHTPVWSPDGTKMAFVTRRDRGRSAIAVAPVDGTGPVHQVTDAPFGQDDWEPTWSGSGERIAFLRRAWDGDTVGDHVWTVDLQTGEQKQVSKRISNRRWLQWMVGKPQVAFVVEDGEWDNVAVINVDNQTSWNFASEAGDKNDLQLSPDGNRLLYTRITKGSRRLFERGTSGASSDELDLGTGDARSPRWLPERRVIYRYTPATGGTRFVVQEVKAKAEQREILPADVWDTDRRTIAPVHLEFQTANGLKLGGLLYRDEDATELLPGVIYLDDRPSQPHVAGYQPFEQALAAAGFAVFTPVVAGTPGYGRKAVNALKAHARAEAEISDLADAARILCEQDGIDIDRIAIVGDGVGGAMALLLAGGRPGYVDAVVAIDPVADWDMEYDRADDRQRAWMQRAYGVPSVARSIYNLRTPATFAGAIDQPVLLIGTGDAPAGRREQLAGLESDLRELGIEFTVQHAPVESEWATALRTAVFLHRVFHPDAEPPVQAAPPVAEETFAAASPDAVAPPVEEALPTLTVDDLLDVEAVLAEAQAAAPVEVIADGVIVEEVAPVVDAPAAEPAPAAPKRPDAMSVLDV